AWASMSPAVDCLNHLMPPINAVASPPARGPLTTTFDTTGPTRSILSVADGVIVDTLPTLSFAATRNETGPSVMPLAGVGISKVNVLTVPTTELPEAGVVVPSAVIVADAAPDPVAPSSTCTLTGIDALAP